MNERGMPKGAFDNPKPQMFFIPPVGAPTMQDVAAEGVIMINATRPRGTMTAEAREALEIYELPNPRRRS